MSTMGSRRSLTSSFLILIAAAIFVLTAGQPAFAVSLDPDLVEQLKSTGQLDRMVDRMNAARSKGVWVPNPSIVSGKDMQGKALSFDPSVPDTFRVLVILVDFSDNPASGGLIYGQPADFEHLLFSDDENDNHYSMAEFYVDNSYGNFVMEGLVVGWVRAPQTYAYYVDGQNGFGSYPQNAQKLAEDAIILADPVVDYSQFDGDGNGWMDGVFIVHAGPGAEQTGSDFQIWSHKWSLSSTLSLDGVNVNSYTAEPEENTAYGLTTMGVYAHEYGHFIGLPDLYDTDYSSSGVGDWSLMAGGSWNNGGKNPAYLDAWCKKDVGFLTPTNIDANSINVDIPSSAHNPVAFRVWSSGGVGSQYFLVENRRKTDLDLGIPGSGLLIYHVDEAIGGNSNENHPKVAVEQADGLFNLENKDNQGDGGDLWSTLTKTSFDDLSMPSSRTYSNGTTEVAVWEISAPDSVMTANFDISYSRPRFELLSGAFSDATLGNGNGVAEAGETLTFEFNVRNLWLTGTNVTGVLEADNNDIIFGQPSSNIGTVAGAGGTADNSSDLIEFTVPSDFVPCIDSFYLTVYSDQYGSEKEFGFELHIGEPTVLVVDDDGGDTWNQSVEASLFNLRTPFDVLDKSVEGSPTGLELSAYESVIWLTGDSRTDVLSTDDIAAMQSFLDSGGNLFLNGQGIVRELDGDDQTFLNTYLHADYLGDYFYPFHYGVGGTEIGDVAKYRFDNGTNQSDLQRMAPLNGGVAEYLMPTDASMISYDGSYKVVLSSVGFEGISDQFVAQGWVSSDSVLVRILEFFRPDTASQNPTVVATAVDEPEPVTHVVDHTPTFAWSYDDTTGATPIEYQVQVGTGNLCYNWDNMWSPPVFAGSDTSVVYDGLPLEDGQTYVFRVRVNNGTTWSAWQNMSFTMNGIGLPSLLVKPVADTLVTTATPVLTIGNSVDPDGDTPTYEFEVYDDAGLTSLVTSATGVAQGGSVTTWTVDQALPDDQQYFWRTRAFDGFEHTAWSEAGSFLVNAQNQAPLAFSLLSPADNVDIEDSLPQFTWEEAIDVDIADQVVYDFQLATDSEFTAIAREFAGLGSTSLLLQTPLDMGLTYYWRVTARDGLSAQTVSIETFQFYAQPPTCCVVRGDVNSSGDVAVDDLTFLVDFLFRGGSAPICDVHGDLNNDGNTNVTDLTYMVDFLFRGGPSPVDCP